MFSKNLKKKVAVLLTGVMVLGMTVTASAGENGGKEGTGNFEGHVNRTVVAVQLPTVAEGATPFNYVMDSEGLLPETNFTAVNGFGYVGGTASEDNIYFKQADGKYYSESESYTVSNNSSVSVNVTMEVAAKDTTAATDATLVSDKAELTGDTAKLYLALNVKHPGDTADEKAVTVAQKASTTIELEGKPENYKVELSQNSIDHPEGFPHDYNFVLKDAVANLDWDTVSFNLIGKANKVANAEGKTAPNLEVTWKFETMEEAAAGAEAAATEAAATAAANTFKTDYPVALKAVNEVVAGDLANITAAQTAFTALSDAAKAKLAANDPAITAETLAALKAKCDELQITDEAAGLIYEDDTFYLGKTTSAGFTSAITVSDIESAEIKVNDHTAHNVKTKVTVVNDNGYWIGVSFADATALGVEDEAGTYSMIVTIGNTRYTGSMTF